MLVAAAAVEGSAVVQMLLWLEAVGVSPNQDSAGAQRAVMWSSHPMVSSGRRLTINDLRQKKRGKVRLRKCDRLGFDTVQVGEGEGGRSWQLRPSPLWLNSTIPQDLRGQERRRDRDSGDTPS